MGQTRWFDAARGVDVPPENRSTGLVFQDYALFPHLTVEANVAFGARNGIGDLLERFEIAGLANERPGSLSGGERQRVALARALARRPSVLASRRAPCGPRYPDPGAGARGARNAPA